MIRVRNLVYQRNMAILLGMCNVLGWSDRLFLENQSARPVWKYYVYYVIFFALNFFGVDIEFYVGGVGTRNGNLVS